eukprot:365117-Chlamydomonas_euryale.AAC.6
MQESTVCKESSFATLLVRSAGSNKPPLEAPKAVWVAAAAAPAKAEAAEAAATAQPSVVQAVGRSKKPGSCGAVNAASASVDIQAAAVLGHVSSVCLAAPDILGGLAAAVDQVCGVYNHA